MSRPAYESIEDRMNEELFVTEANARWNCMLYKLPKAYHLDFACVRDHKVVSWIEFKVRHNSITTYPTTMVPLQKVMRAREFARETGLPTLYCAKFDEGYYYLNFNEQPEKIQIMGRTDRNDKNDIEPQALFSVELLREI